MASNASSASSSIQAENRPQAGPLPRKRGEIGYRESLNQEQVEEQVQEQDVTETLPDRHPADRENSAPSNESLNQASQSGAPQSTQGSSTPLSVQKTRKAAFSSFLHRVGKTSLGGINLPTLVRFAVQLTFLALTVAAWVIIIKRLGRVSSNSSSGDVDSVTFGGTGGIFVHVSFGVATLGQLLFLERCIFHMRAQHYNYRHPNATLPTHARNRSGNTVGMGFAPWNRPSLPTYAAALAQSGLGTGDVEDNAIAIPPPPAYGNTRGSTLLLAGLMRNSLRRDIPPDEGERRLSERRYRESSRPVSYVSRDEEWEERCDAERALQLADTLARLEEGSSSTPARSRSTNSGS